VLVIWLGAALVDVALDGRDEGEPGDEVSNKNRNEGETELYSAETPLLVDESERLDEHEDESVRETR